MPESAERFFRYEYSDGTDDPLMPADEGSWSIEGLAHAATITTHYLLEGRIRRRAPYSDKFRIYIGPPKEGSWVADFFIALSHADVWAGAVAGSVVGGALASTTGAFRLLRRVSNRATGVEPASDITEQFEDQRPGDFDALVEAAEPSLLRAHRVISDNFVTINVSVAGLRFTFNRRTRRYIEQSNLDARATEERGNVASYNVNGRTGRIYFETIGRTVPFTISRQADERTEVALARSLENYAVNRIANRDIDITYRARRAEDGRIKSIIVFDADFIFGTRG
jgi:hypothetical protein